MITKVYSAARDFISNHDYKLNNVFIYDWESDLFCVTKSGYSIEIEVKVSKADFRADFKKPKHDLMKAAFDKQKYLIYDKKVMQNYRPPVCYFRISEPNQKTPNKFYYACPDGMISVDQVPDYAGLIYCNQAGNWTVVKNAPFIHKTKHDYENRLLSKFYHRRNNALFEAKQALYSIEKATIENIKGIATYRLGLIKRILE